MKPPVHLIVDGYNVIHGLERFLKGTSLEEKRNQLQKAVELLAQAEGMEWTLCFDGRKLQGPREEDPHILFSQGEGADALMERMVYQSEEREGIVCVTDDRVLGNFLFGLGVSILSVDQFEKRLKKVEQAFGF